MKAGYRYDAKTCFRCGNLVHYNWYIRHRRSGCMSGVAVAAPSNNAVHLTPAAAGSRDDNDTEPQAQVKQTVRRPWGDAQVCAPLQVRGLRGESASLVRPFQRVGASH